MELAEEFHKIACGQRSKLTDSNEEKVLNSFNYFCVFCLRFTLMDNLGNFSRCQECNI